jgi:hypothetical protein
VSKILEYQVNTKEQLSGTFSLKNSIKLYAVHVTRCSNRIKSYLCGRKIRLAKGMHLLKSTTRRYICSDYAWSDEKSFQLRMMFSDYDAARKTREEYHQYIGKTVLENPLMNRLMNLCTLRDPTGFKMLKAEYCRAMNLAVSAMYLENSYEFYETFWQNNLDCQNHIYNLLRQPKDKYYEAVVWRVSF